jgi:hypothetical protein
MPIDLSLASELIDFSARMPSAGKLADDQLKGAVAIHNLLESRKVAYLADEVGMGKTYVALGAIALFRHFDPHFRVLFLTPRRNIQMKWVKEQRNFVKHNLRFADMRNRAPDGRPIRSMVACESLSELVRESSLDRDRDFFTRMSSFSMAVTGQKQVDKASALKLRAEFKRHMPWLRDEIFDAPAKAQFKDNLARALCCMLPTFDLVVVDEAHNLKSGFQENVAARNRVLGLALGRSEEAIDSKLFPGYGTRGTRYLFLSATPVEDSYHQLWNQLNVFGIAEPFHGLINADCPDSEKKDLARSFLIRRVNEVAIGSGKEFTRNLYRREWRQGGVIKHDDPIKVEDDRQRLVLALVQKKVSELLGHERFGGSFQMGMLASFESFHETTTRLLGQEASEGNFDGADQTQDAELREGVDVKSINALASSYRRCFKQELPHPKMDEVLKALVDAWKTGSKALVFVRRVASVKEIKAKLDDAYDAWLFGRLEAGLPAEAQVRLQETKRQYLAERRRSDPSSDGGLVRASSDEAVTNRAGRDTFFAWFFRDEARADAPTRALNDTAFFEENTTAEILGCRPEQCLDRMASLLQCSLEEVVSTIGQEARGFKQGSRKKDPFLSVHAAACKLLKELPGGHQPTAKLIWTERWQQRVSSEKGSTPQSVAELLCERTFFSALQDCPVLADCLWPTRTRAEPRLAYREKSLRAQLLASAVRLGHSIVDFYLVEQGANTAHHDGLIDAFIALLESQRQTPASLRGWGAFDELEAIASNLDVIIDVNLPDWMNLDLSSTATVVGRLLRQQQPVGGMAGQVNETLVRQFRMPGYPMVLVSTDLLQEGEDLHTFCSVVHHYGISWTPSAMEQRTGRIDRARSQTERRIQTLEELKGEDMLQVHIPYLQGTIEVLQVQRVLERMNQFIRMMHEGLIAPEAAGKAIDVNQGFLESGGVVPQIKEALQTSFPIDPRLLRGSRKALAVAVTHAEGVERRFDRLGAAGLPGLRIHWDDRRVPGMHMGTVALGQRHQPFTLILRTFGDRMLVRCVSPVGCALDRARSESTMRPVRIAALDSEDAGSYDLTVEGDVLLGVDPAADLARVAGLVSRVCQQADDLESAYLPDRDRTIEEFRAELEQEVTVER